MAKKKKSAKKKSAKKTAKKKSGRKKKAKGAKKRPRRQRQDQEGHVVCRPRVSAGRKSISVCLPPRELTRKSRWISFPRL